MRGRQHAALELQPALAADSQLDLCLLAEPLPDLLRLSDHPPHHLDGSVDQDFLLDRGRDHAARVPQLPVALPW